MNTSEKLVAEFLEKSGSKVIRNGWPDFLCLKYEYDRASRKHTENIKGAYCVEVKTGKDKLSPVQIAVHSVLKACGMPVYVLNPDSMRNKKGQIVAGKTFLTADEITVLRENVKMMQERVDYLQSEILKTQELFKGAEVLFEDSIAHPAWISTETFNKTGWK